MIKQRSLYSSSDMNMYLSGCIVGYRHSNGKVKAYNVQEVCDNEVRLSGQRGAGKCVPVDDDRLVLDWPTLGVVQVGAYVSYIMTDSFDRQYKKSIRNRGLIVNTVMEREACALGIIQRELSLDVFTGMYNPVNLDIAEAIEELSRKVAVRINRDYFLTWKNGYANPMLGYRDLLIGEVVGNSVELLPSFKHMLPHVSKLITTTVKDNADG